jgi:hypothetical protein
MRHKKSKLGPVVFPNNQVSLVSLLLAHSPLASLEVRSLATLNPKPYHPFPIFPYSLSTLILSNLLSHHFSTFTHSFTLTHHNPLPHTLTHKHIHHNSLLYTYTLTHLLTHSSLTILFHLKSLFFFTHSYLQIHYNLILHIQYFSTFFFYTYTHQSIHSSLFFKTHTYIFTINQTFPNIYIQLILQSFLHIHIYNSTNTSNSLKSFL